jgi:hypothetical protein
MKPPHKLLKPNAENVLRAPPFSLGNLLILPKKVHTVNTRFRGRGGNV